MIEVRFKIDEYTKRVLDTIKGKYGLKNRNEALKKFVNEEGKKYIKPNELILKDLDDTYKRHKEKHKERTMSDEELRNLLDV